MKQPQHITVLGGGPAGLAVGYYAKLNHLPFSIYEANGFIGGNCITWKQGDFLFDSGAHRFHDKNQEITQEVKKLLGKELKKINSPSQIYYDNNLIDFPLSPLNIIQKFGLWFSIKTGIELVLSRLKKPVNTNFENFAIYTYGRTIASYFLLNYSEKLWGAPCYQLSPSISGKRLQGLDLKTFLTEACLGSRKKVEHLDGLFYYPQKGIGRLSEKLGEFCGEANILKTSKITKIFHENRKIQAIEINHNQVIETHEVVSTLPLSITVQLMDPIASEDALLAAQNLRFRNLILVALFLNVESITQNASIYFPDRTIPFTRVYEPKNRSLEMCPLGKTSLVAEIPCQKGDQLWKLKDDQLVRLVTAYFIQAGWFKDETILDAKVVRINHAYPILELGYEEKVHKINAFLQQFDNLKTSGRNGKFVYAHFHDMMKFGKEVIEDYLIE